VGATTNAGRVYLDLIAVEWAHQRSIKESLEARAAHVATWSGALVAAALALLGLGSVDGPLTIAAVLVGVVLLTVSTLFGVAVVYPRDYGAAEINRLRDVLHTESFMAADEVIGQERVGELLLKMLERAREVDRVKVGRLRWALRLFAGGILALAVAVLTVGVAGLL
jgi:hypothetical protein